MILKLPIITPTRRRIPAGPITLSADDKNSCNLIPLVILVTGRLI